MPSRFIMMLLLPFDTKLPDFETIDRFSTTGSMRESN
jgi:hypothetical protein